MFLDYFKQCNSCLSINLSNVNIDGFMSKPPNFFVCFSIGFTCMFKHCYIPLCMINSVIIPLIKNKCGDHTDKNNYRPIVLSIIISKVFEHIIAERLEVYL